MAQKLLARVSGADSVSVGDVVMGKLHVITLLDVGTHVRWVRQNDLRAWDPRRVLICFDHFMAGAVPDSAISWMGWMREFAREQGIPAENLFDIGRHGLSHQIPAEQGWVLPGTFYAAQDTEAPTMGAFNCFAL